MKPGKTHSTSSSPKRSDLKEKGVFSKGSFKFQGHTHSNSTISFSFSLHFNGKVDSHDHIKGSNSSDQMMESGGQPEPQTWCEKKQAAVHEEIRRMRRLPANSTYVAHRLRVLNKILQLTSIQRNVSQEEELELLFAGLSL